MPSQVEHYGAIAVFVRIASTGSFTVAARSLGLSTSQVSRTLAALEGRLGAQLVNRSTRKLSLTDAGRLLFDRGRLLLADLDDAVEAVHEAGAAPRGTLRVTAPVQFGQRYLSPVVAAFAAAHPAVRFELAYDDRRVDIVAEGFDVAIRIARLADTSLVARRLGSIRSRTVATPSYLQKHGTPAHPSELASHDCIVSSLAGDATTWRFAGEREVVVKVRPRLVVSGVESVVPFVLAGLGVGRVPEAVLAGEVQAGRLVPILSDWDPHVPVQALYPPARSVSPKVRQFVNFLAEQLAHEPWSCGGRAAESP